ncbi:MAG: GIY-YIG nuclease family protein, partial [Patescibacteria group bacterium]
MPSSPGVYWFLDENAKVLYVGKAKDLHKRVYSYTRVGKHALKTLNLVLEAVKLKFQVLTSELEALLIEAELINAHQPHYNILLKDDKSPLYVIITNDEFPRVLTARKQKVFGRKGIKAVFGPFPSTGQVRYVLKLAR